MPHPPSAPVVVTGAAGFIGSTLVDRLLGAGHRVLGLDGFIGPVARSIKEANVRDAQVHPGYRLVELDLRTGELEPWLDGVDAVIHAAAIPGLAGSWSDPALSASCNVLATQRLLDACRRTGVGRFVLASTSSIYGRLALGDEDAPPRPVSPYSATKLAAERLVLDHVERSGLSATIVRYFSVYGPRQRPDMAYHRFIEAMLEDRPITVFGDGGQTRSNTYIDDAVTGTLLALERGRSGVAYNLAGDERVSLDGAIALIAAHLGVDARRVFGPARAGDQRHTGARIDRTRAELGFSPTIALAEGLERQIAWHRARRERAATTTAPTATTLAGVR